mgnify:CR=1 FL=1
MNAVASRSIPIEISPVLRDLITVIFCYQILRKPLKTLFAEYNPGRNSIDVYTSADYMLRIDCWEAEKNLRTTPGSDCALNTLAIDEPLEYARLYLDGNL